MPATATLRLHWCGKPQSVLSSPNPQGGL